MHLTALFCCPCIALSQLVCRSLTSTHARNRQYAGLPCCVLTSICQALMEILRRLKLVSILLSPSLEECVISTPCVILCVVPNAPTATLLPLWRHRLVCLCFFLLAAFRGLLSGLGNVVLAPTWVYKIKIGRCTRYTIQAGV